MNDSNVENRNPGPTLSESGATIPNQIGHDVLTATETKPLAHNHADNELRMQDLSLEQQPEKSKEFIKGWELVDVLGNFLMIPGFCIGGIFFIRGKIFARWCLVISSQLLSFKIYLSKLAKA